MNLAPATSVVDCSVAIAALVDLDGPGSWANEVVESRVLVAPDLLPYEGINTLRRLVLSKIVTTQAATLAHASLMEWPIDLWPSRPLAGRIWDLRGSLTAYDAAYVALAELLDAPLLTLDARLAKAAARHCEVVAPS